MNKSQNPKFYTFAHSVVCLATNSHPAPHIAIFVLPLSRLNIIFISSGHIEAAYVFFLVFPPVYLSLNNIS
jgi:hypothetical protein